MANRDSVELVVKSYSAWAPGLVDEPSWQAWAQGSLALEASAVPPTVRFVEPLLRRRLSPLSRMAFQVARDCLEENDHSAICIYCSRYGEFARAYELLCCLARGEPLSPNTFSLSVHNTSSSLFSIWREDRAHSTTIAAGEATLEAGYIEAWSMLSDGAASTALVVYCDQPLPAAYASQPTSVDDNCAVALLLRLPDEEESDSRLRLSWQPTDGGADAKRDGGSSALDVMKLLLAGGKPVTLESDRLSWTWSLCSAAH